MGNTNTQSKQLRVVRSAHQPDLWKVVENIVYCDVVTNLETEQTAESYTIPMDGRVKLQEEHQKYQFRRTQNDHLVKVYQVSKRNSEYLCSGIEFLNVKTERILYRLSQMRNLLQSQGVYLMHCMFLGYKKIRQLLQPLKIDKNMIGVTPNGQIKVWLNENLAKNYPELEYELSSEVSDVEAQNIMTNQIIEIVLSQIESGTKMHRIIKSKIQKKQMNTFEEGIKLCKQVAFEMKINIRNARINMKNSVSKINLKQQGENGEQQLKFMEVSNIGPIEELAQHQALENDSGDLKIIQPMTPKWGILDDNKLINFQNEIVDNSNAQEKPFSNPSCEETQNIQKQSTVLVQSSQIPIVTQYNPTNQFQVSINVIPPERQSYQIISQDKSMFPVMNQSKSKGKPPKPVSQPKGVVQFSKIPDEVIDTINEIERSRSKQLNRSFNGQRRQFCQTNIQSITPTQSPIRSRTKSYSKSESDNRISMNQSSFPTNVPSPKVKQIPFSVQKQYHVKPYTPIEFKNTSFDTSNSSFITNQRPFAINNITDRSKLPIKYFHQSIMDKKYSSAQKHKTIIQSKTPQKIQFKRPLAEKPLTASRYQPNTNFDFDQINNKFFEPSVKQPSFGLIPRSDKLTFTQISPSQLYKGALKHKLDLSQYTYQT